MAFWKRLLKSVVQYTSIEGLKRALCQSWNGASPDLEKKIIRAGAPRLLLSALHIWVCMDMTSLQKPCLPENTKVQNRAVLEAKAARQQHTSLSARLTVQVIHVRAG